MTKDSNYDDSYTFLLSAAHRKPPYWIGTPSITWHQGFWKPELPRVTKEDRRAKRAEQLTEAEWEEKWITSIEYFILDIYMRLLNNAYLEPGSPLRFRKEWDKLERDGLFISNLQLDQQNARDAHVMLLRHRYVRNLNGTGFQRNPNTGRYEKDPRFPFLGKELKDPKRPKPASRSRYETVHLESFWRTMPISIRVEVFDEYFTLMTTLDLSRRTERTATLGQFVEAGNPVCNTVFKSMNAVIAKANAAYTKRVTNTGERIEKSRFAAELEDPARNLYYSVWEKFSADVLMPAKDLDTKQRLGWVFADFRNIALRRGLPGDDLRRSLIPDIAKQSRDNRYKDRPFYEGAPFSETEAVDWTEAVFPILLAPEARTRHSYPAATIEYTFSRLARSRCIYGSGFGAPTSQHPDGVPLTYVTLFTHSHVQPIGRVISRLVTAGTCRMAALYGLNRMRASAQVLADLDRELDAIAQDIVDHHKGEKQATAIDEKLHDFHRKMGEVELESPPGIAFRTQRSLYYRERFDMLVKAMHIQNVTGFQPYDQFVRHRLERAHSLFEAIGARFSNLQKKVARVREHWVTVKSEDHQKEIEKIQAVGEFVLFWGLLPYYLSHIVTGLFPDEDESAFWDYTIKQVATFGSICFSILAWMALERLKRRSRRSHSMARPGRA